MNKKDYQLFGCVLAKVENDLERENLICFLKPIFERDNHLFDEWTFREFIKRLRNRQSLKGLRVNQKYMYN